MLKIQLREAEGQIVLQVEGRLAGAFVPELEASWQEARAAQPSRQIALDLQNVICLDQAGRYLLQWMHSNGVPFLRTSLATRELLGEIHSDSD